MSRHLLILGGTAADRGHAARLHVPATHSVFVADAATLPFTLVSAISLPAPPRAIVIDEIDRAFPDRQAGGTRLVLTQSIYLLQKWVDRLDAGDRIIATADRETLERCAPEFLQARGCWSAFEIRDVGAGDWGLGARPSEDGAPASASPKPQAPSP